jgi:hypothetical protein
MNSSAEPRSRPGSRQFVQSDEGNAVTVMHSVAGSLLEYANNARRRRRQRAPLLQICVAPRTYRFTCPWRGLLKECALPGLTRFRRGELLGSRHSIDLRPHFGNATTFDPKNVDARPSRYPTGRREFTKAALLGASGTKSSFAMN